MRLFGKVNSAIDRFDRAGWLTMPFDKAGGAPSIDFDQSWTARDNTTTWQAAKQSVEWTARDNPTTWQVGHNP